MLEYPKIDTLFDRDAKFKVICRAGGHETEQWRLPEFEYLKDNSWFFTEKVDGTNIRVTWDGKTITIQGRTDEAQIPPFLVKKINELVTPEKMALVFPTIGAPSPEPLPQITLFGEGYGAKIQKGGGNYKPDGVDFVLFDVLVGNWWLKWDAVLDVGNKLDIKVVPVIGSGTLLDATAIVHSGFKSQWGDFPAEGLVVRPRVDLFTRSGQRVIGKIKVRDF